MVPPKHQVNTERNSLLKNTWICMHKRGRLSRKLDLVGVSRPGWCKWNYFCQKWTINHFVPKNANFKDTSEKLKNIQANSS